MTLAATLPYLNAIQAGFVFDDPLVICDSPVITGPFDLGAVLGVPLYPGNLYRPLTLLTYSINEHLAPGSAAPFHAVNIALHAAVTLLVFALGAVLCRSRSTALVAALLFAVHPIHTEAVTGIVGRAELLAALFGLSALLATLRSIDARRPGWDGLALLAFTAALFSKESAVTVLPLIPLCRAAYREGNLWPNLARELRSGHWFWFACAVALFIVTRMYLVGSLTLPTRPIPLDNVLAYTPPLVRLWSACAILADYASLLLVPLLLSADYSWRQVVPVDSWTSLRAWCGLGLIVASVFGFFWYGKRRPVLSVLAVFSLITMSLTANVLFLIGTVKAERLLYLPSVGFTLLVAILGPRDRPWWTGRLTGALLVVVLAAFAGRTWARNWDWVDSVTLFRATVEAAPRSAKAHHNFATALARVGQPDEAALHYREALRLYEDYAESAFGIGANYEEKGLANGAIAWYRKALAIDPGHRSSNTNLCGLLFKLGDFAAAETACRHGLLFEPTDANFIKMVGASLVQLGDRTRGLTLMRRSLALNPSDVPLRATLERTQAEATPSG